LSQKRQNGAAQQFNDFISLAAMIGMAQGLQ
jgi:hypothetical protein